MTPGPSSSPSGPDPLQQVLDETRARFIATFAAQWENIRVLVAEVATHGPSGPVASLTQVVHRMSGLAGTIGFPTISARASELEDLLDHAGAGRFDARQAHVVVEALRAAFGRDLHSAPVAATPTITTATGAKILIAEDEAEQLAIVKICLEAAGYVAVSVASGDLVLEAVRAERPALILLDIAMPKLDGFTLCRRLKADADLKAIPVIFMTTGANLNDKLTGLSLGADEFLSKPLDLRELVLRIEILLRRVAALRLAAGNPPDSKELTGNAFHTAVAQQMARTRVALAMVWVPADRHEEAAALLTEELRGRDRIGAYGPTHLLILLPDLSAGEARGRLEPVASRIVASGVAGLSIGVSGAAGTAAKSVEALIAEAGEALAEARYLGSGIAVWTGPPAQKAVARSIRTIVVAEDDPDVTRIVDAQLRAGGYATFIAFDGDEAVAAVQAHAPDVLVLDLMMPKTDGFGVLTTILNSPLQKPRIIVLSARGREHDVVRAFDLGADDYMTKPFNPQELLARIARLLREPATQP